MSIAQTQTIIAKDDFVLQVNSDGVSKQGTAWHNETMFIVEAQGDKISKITEFMDTAFVKGFVDAEKAKA